MNNSRRKNKLQNKNGFYNSRNFLKQIVQKVLYTNAPDSNANICRVH